VTSIFPLGKTSWQPLVLQLLALKVPKLGLAWAALAIPKHATMAANSPKVFVISFSSDIRVESDWRAGLADSVCSGSEGAFGS
jgi:hypothetical protein